MRRVLYIFILILGTLKVDAQVFTEGVKPLVKTQWSQGEPYNLLCPKDSVTKKHKRAGCGPIAMAQIVKYYESPKTSPDGKLTYKFDQMFDAYVKGFSTIEQLTNVSHLIATCGISAFTEYGIEASSTSGVQLVIAMQRLLGYSKYMHFVYRNKKMTPDTEQAFADAIYKELKEGRPIIMAGKKPGQKSGHLFIVDGCKGDKVHLNLGWGEEQNGYYKLSNLAGYTEDVSMIVGIAPDADYTPHIQEFHIALPGTFSSMVKDVESLKHIKLSGSMNTTDLAVLRLLARSTTNSIDMEDVEMTEMPDSAFFQANALVYIKLPKTLTKIGRRAFMQSRLLRRVDMPDGLTTIGRSAFLGNTSMIRVNLPESVKTIGNQAFSNCKSIVACAVPEGVESIGTAAFEECEKLKILRLPSTVKRVGADVVKGCPRLQTFTMPDIHLTLKIEEKSVVTK